MDVLLLDTYRIVEKYIEVEEEVYIEIESSLRNLDRTRSSR
jgi:hypothetical protein